MWDCYSLTCCVSRTFGSSRNVGSLSLFYKHSYFGRCSYELALKWYHFLNLEEGLPVIDKLRDFSATIPRRYKNVYINSFFPLRARLWNSRSVEWFALTEILCLQVVFEQISYILSFFVLLFLVTLCLVVAVPSCMELIWITKNPQT